MNAYLWSPAVVYRTSDIHPLRPHFAPSLSPTYLNSDAMFDRLSLIALALVGPTLANTFNGGSLVRLDNAVSH